MEEERINVPHFAEQNLSNLEAKELISFSCEGFKNSSV